ncbi:MAG TPA: methyltransferase domain-containing protein, partial [Planctomycetota bacterium]|nr:methyltransferase domain-containing protein [Planctomycetota bacterium]
MDPAAFRQFAALEDRHWWFVGRRRLYPALLAAVLERDLGRPPAGLSVVDVGCGVGGFLAPLRRFGAVLGLEPDEGALAWCRQRGFARTAVASSAALPLADSSQDLLCLWDVLEHTPDDRAALVEARRCLRPGGHLALSVPAYPWLYSNNDRVARHYRRYTRPALRARLAEAGFELRKATYVNVALAPAIVPAVLLIKLKERLIARADDATTNLSWPLPRPLHAL